MTEYDYSPDAIHRHMENQSRVARWVDNTEAHASQFRSPFGTRSDVGLDEEDMERSVGGGRGGDPYYQNQYHRGHRRTDGFNEMSAGLSTVGDSPAFSPGAQLHGHGHSSSSSYPPNPPRGPLPGQSPYAHMYPSYQPQPHLLPASAYTTPSPLASPPPPIIIQSVSSGKRHRRHHRDDSHHHSHSRSKSHGHHGPRTYIITQQPVPASAPVPQQMQYMSPPPPPSYGYAGYPGHGQAQYPPPPAATHMTSPPPPPPVVSPTPTYGYPTHASVQQQSVPGYVIVSPKGRGVKVLYA